MIKRRKPVLGPSFDKNGYPDDRSLRKLEKWPVLNAGDIPALLDYASQMWNYPDSWRAKGRYVRVSTGGCSGNETIIGALQANRMFWSLCWQSSCRGGHYVFKIPKFRK